MNEFVNWLNAAGNAFVTFGTRMLVQSSVLILALLVLDLVLRRRVKAVVRYWIWLLVLVKLILPPSLSSPVSLGWWLGDALPEAPAHLAKITEDSGGKIPSSPLPPISLNEVGRMPAAIELAARPEPAFPPGLGETTIAARTAPPEATLSWKALMLIVWLGVVLMMLVLLAQRALFVRGLVRQSEEAPERLRDLLDQCRRQMGVRTAVRLRLTSLSASPSVCGLIRPKILVPQRMLTHLDGGQLKSILLHELAHVRRADLWVNLAQTLLQIVYVYHPLVWLANTIIRKVREQAVDETVLAAMGDEAETYPRTLLTVSKLAFDRPALSLRLVGVVESKRTLAARIKHIASRPFPRTAKLGLTGLVLILAIAVFLLPMAKARSQDNKSPAGDKATPMVSSAEGSPASTNSSDKPVAGGTIECLVTDALGRARQCAYVAPQGKDVWYGVMTDAEGRVDLQNVQPDQRVWCAWSQASRLYGVFALPDTMPAGPVHVVLNLGEADLEGRVVGADGKPVANRKVEIVVTTPAGIRLPLGYQPETDAYGYYSHGSVPSGEGLTIGARLVETDDGGESFATAPVKILANPLFIELPLLVAARHKTQPDFDRNLKDDGMLHCGGQVLDEAGNPLAGIRVHLSFDMPGYMGMWIRDAMTDERGRWRRPVPPSAMDLSIEFEHPEHYLDEPRRPAREELAGGTHTTVMKRGLTLEGKVTNERGEPVENVLVCAKVSYGRTPGPYNQIIEDSTTDRTRRDGAFCIRGLPPGARSITVYPDRYAPTTQTVDIREGMTPARITVRAGRTYRGQVVDVRGNPMEGIRVGTDQWQVGKERRNMSRLSTTDAQGMFTLANLPEGQIEIDFGRKTGYLGFSKDLPPGTPQIDEVVMYEVPRFTGRVVDADTDEPIADFEIVNGIHGDEDASVSWSRYHRSSIKDPNGAFTHQWAGYHISYPASSAACIKIEAKGYLASAPALLELGQTCEPLIIRMNKGASITGTVLQPDGSPAAKAQIAFVRRGEKAFIDRDQLSAGGFVYQAEITATADENGRFELPPTGEPGLLVAVHRAGYAQVQSTQFTGGSTIHLLAWARVEGTLDRSRVAEKDIEIALWPLEKSSDGHDPCICWLLGRVTPTGDTFAFDCVPSVPLVVGRIARYEMHNGSYLVPEPGKTCQVEVGAHGRRVIGRIVPPYGLPQNRSVAFTDPRRVHAVAFKAGGAAEIPAAIAVVDEQSFNWLWQDKEDVYEPSKALRKRYVPTILEDGSFAFDGLEPGVYEFVVNAHAALGENVSCGRGVLEAVAVSGFTVPEGRATTAVSVPDIRLRLLTYPQVGEPAPPFEARTFDGTSIRLADLRGRVVLLDFWATWCQPCVAQLPHMQRIYETFAADDRFAMIGMSLDWDIEKVGNFLAARQLKWPQVSLGSMDTSTVVKQYGVGSIPATILIDPEGKIVAMGAAADELEEKIGQALAGGVKTPESGSN